jgi:hypothetical protein
LTNHIGDGDVTDIVFVSGPVIARLALRTRKWAHEHLRRGSFGPVFEQNGVLFAGLDRVEKRCGRQFSYAQINRLRVP